MEAEKSTVKDVATCALCSVQLDDQVKLLPCKSRVCEDCLRTLGTDSSSGFKCPFCQDTHLASEAKLSDQPASSRLIKSSIGDIQEKLGKLKLFDRREQINELCDSISLDIMETVESAVNHLNQLGNDLLQQVNEYRQELLSSGTDLPFIIQSPVNSPQQQVRDLSNQVTEFSAGVDNQDLETAQRQVKHYQTKIERLEADLKAQIFKGKVLKFKENHLFCLTIDHLGSLVVEEPESFDVDSGK